MKGSRGHYSKRWVYIPGNGPAAHCSEAVLELSRDQYKHLVSVLRLPNGAEVIATNGQGQAFNAVLGVSNHGATLTLGHPVPIDRMSLRIEFYVGLPKNPTMDEVVEKATECGVASIKPFVTSRSVVKPGPGELHKYSTRWRDIAQNALEQCQTPWLPKVYEPTTFDVVLSDFAKQIKNGKSVFVFASEIREESNVAQTYKILKQTAAQNEHLSLVIGPEGGFSAQELEAFLQAGCTMLSLGANILRVQTAAVQVLTLGSLALFERSGHND